MPRDSHGEAMAFVSKLPMRGRPASAATRRVLGAIALLVLVLCAGAHTAAARGYRGTESNRIRLHAGQAEAFRLRARTSETAHVVQIYVGSGSTARGVVVGIYSNAGNRPESLLSGGYADSLKAHRWSAVAIAPAWLASGRTYWLAVLGWGGVLRYRSPRRGTCLSNLSTRTHLHRLPRRWGTGRVRTRARCPISAYVAAAGLIPSLGPTFAPGGSSPTTSTPRDSTPPGTGATSTPGGAASVPASPTPPPGEPAPPSESKPPSEPPPAEETTPPEEPEPPEESTPTVPANTKPPSIGGTAIVGNGLHANHGSWTGSPIAYSYRWEDCNAAGASCSPIGGTTGPSYTLTTGDEQHTVRVVVTATNEAGEAQATSAATAVVVPPAPANTVAPEIGGSPVEGQMLTASDGTWTGEPTTYAYQWEDCFSLGEEGCLSVSGATGPTYVLQASDVGYTMRVVVTATNAGGFTPATSAATAEVEEAPPPPPEAPKNTQPPSISGVAEEGKTLMASAGSWSNNPTSYAYQWQDCNVEGKGCANLAEAKEPNYKLTSADVGDEVRVVVTATNAEGSSKVSSAATGEVVATPPSGPNLTAKECWEDPGQTGENTAEIEACGYPGFNNTGVEASAKGSLIAETGTIHFSSSGWENTTTKVKGSGTYENRKLKGQITIAYNAAPELLKNDEIYTEAGCTKESTNNEPCNTQSVEYDGNGEVGASGFVFSHMRIGGTEIKGPNSVQNCINDRHSGTYVAEYVKCIYGGGFVLNGGGELNHVYCPANQEETGAHYECTEDEGNTVEAKPLIIKNSTVFNPPTENFGETDRSGSEAGFTAALFTQETFGTNKVGEVILEKDFYAGGAFTVYSEAKVPLTVKATRFARCLPATCPKSSTEEAPGDHDRKIRGNTGDGHGWYEEVGLYGILDTGAPKPVWEKNFLDDDLKSVTIAEAQGSID